MRIFTGDVIEIFRPLKEQQRVAALWSHEETGNSWTYARDKRVAAWAQEAGVVWHELRHTGVVRRLKSRDGWARRWDADMALPQTPPPTRLTGPLGTWPVAIPTARDLGLTLDPCPDRQPGARAAGLQTLHSFLTRRGRDYRFEISSPITAFDSCSRLSPHIAWGTLSLREIAQATTERLRGLSPEAPDARRVRGSLISFAGRQHWHCHFMQKLEDAPRIESGSSSKRHSRYTSGKANRT